MRMAWRRVNRRSRSICWIGDQQARIVDDRHGNRAVGLTHRLLQHGGHRRLGLCVRDKGSLLERLCLIHERDCELASADRYPANRKIIMRNRKQSRRHDRQRRHASKRHYATRFESTHVRNYSLRAASILQIRLLHVKTASFFSYAGPGRVSIARYVPRGLAPGYRIYRALAPGPWFNSVPYERYLELYNTQLAALEPKQVWNDLQSLVAPHEPVLLCWERPPLSVTHWCHRTMVAQWFALQLGHTVSELEPRPPR